MFLRTPHGSMLSLLALASLTFACGTTDPDPGGGGGGGGGGPANVAGTWDWALTETTSTCGSEANDVWVVTITQSGSDITATSQWGSDVGGPHPFAGTVTGNAVVIPNVMYEEDGGDLSASHDLTLQSDGTMAGTETWTWTGDAGTCANGTSTLRATRQ